MTCSNEKLLCPICGEILQKYGEVDPDAGTSTILGANCSKCGIKDSDIKLWQELIRTKKQLEIYHEFVTKLYLNRKITDKTLIRLQKRLSIQKGDNNE